MSVLSRLTDSLLVRLLFRSILLLLHVDNALLFSYKFQIICIAFCSEFIQCTVCSSREYACILLLHSPWRISLIWAGNFSLALDFPFKYWPLRPSTLCLAGLSILYRTTWYNISTICGCSTTMMMVMGNLLGIMKEIKASSVILLQVHIVMVHPGTHLTCEKSWVPVQNQWVPVKKKKNESKIENAWAFM